MNCNKNKYSSKTEALITASRRLGSKSSDCYTLRPYYCKECKGWHLTKQDKE